MPESDPLHERVSAVESEVTRLSEENAATRVMAAMADRDVAEFRAVQKAHTKVLNALRETQVDHGSILREHGQTLNQHTQILHEHGQILHDNTHTLNEHTQFLHDHTQALDALKAGQSELRGELRKQSTTQRGEMAELRADVANLGEGQAAILRHLGIKI